MNLSNYYWYAKEAIPAKICDDIVKHGLFFDDQLGRTGDINLNKKILSKKEEKNLKKKRNSNITWLNDPWIYKEIHPYVHQANLQAGWNFQWDWSESCQFTKYKLNQYYDWHCDSWNKPYETNQSYNNGKIRKLSVTCQLSNPSDYAGGELQFDFRNQDPEIIKTNNHIVTMPILAKGSIIVFPSFVWHRVKPVTKGIRYSLVVWNLGWPFK